jgi:Alcohol dehydrogenase GroES-like domain
MPSLDTSGEARARHLSASRRATLTERLKGKLAQDASLDDPVRAGDKNALQADDISGCNTGRATTVVCMEEDILAKLTALHTAFDARRPVGRRVVAINHSGLRAGGSCGYCEFCRNGDLVSCQNQAFTGVHHDGGYAEMMIAKASGLVSVPDDLSSVDACGPHRHRPRQDPALFVGRAGGDGWTLIVAPAINAGVIGRGGEIA